MRDGNLIGLIVVVGALVVMVIGVAVSIDIDRRWNPLTFTYRPRRRSKVEEAVAAERERIATAIENAGDLPEWTAQDDCARIARSSHET